MSRVLVGLSGGVDSAVAALRLVREGHDVVAFFMSHDAAIADGRRRACCSADDAYDARRVADRLGIPFYALDFEAEFRPLVDDFVASYARGETPNPCVRCNRELKFGRAFDYADATGAQFIATGHYARIGPGPSLLRAADRTKDQSYMLFNIPRERLGRVMFPLADLRKDDARRIAREAGLPIADKPDSAGVCFLGGQDLAAFLAPRIPVAPGEVRTTDGRVVGAHDGVHRFTIGQRGGLGVALGEPRYVTAIDPAARTVTLGRGDDLMARRIRLRELHWLADAAFPLRADVQVRAHAAPEPATIGAEGSVEFDDRVRAPAPGQAAVFYDGDRVLGGGWIDRSE